MRPALSITLCLGVLTTCESDRQVAKTNLVWMDWPAEVNANESFRTRLVVWGVCARDPQFRAGASANQEAVTFSPYFLIDDENVVCVGRATESFVVVALDTAGRAPGLAALMSRTYEMRGTVPGFTRVLDNSPIWTFGDVHVVPSGADGSRRNAAGDVSKEIDSLDCVRIRPAGLYSSSGALVLEDQADTAGLSNAFVRGYIYDAPAPVCGETRVFHLLSRQ